MRLNGWLLLSALALVVPASGCGTCHAQSECEALDGYAAYDSHGKLAPSSMCGVVGSRDGELAHQCGAHFHWDTPSGRCDCDAVTACEGAGQYTWQNCQFKPSAGSSSDTGGAGGSGGTSGAGGGGTGGAGGGGAGGGGGGSGANCVDFTSTPPAVAAFAASGTAPAPTGGALADGSYRVTAVDVYGTTDPAGTQVATFGGAVKLAGPSFETAYGGSNVATFYGKGTLTMLGNTAQVAFTCSSGGTASASFPYSVTSSTMFTVTMPGQGYTAVTTYTAISP